MKQFGAAAAKEIRSRTSRKAAMPGLEAGDLSAGAQGAKEAAAFHRALLPPPARNGNADTLRADGDRRCRFNARRSNDQLRARSNQKGERLTSDGRSEEHTSDIQSLM